MTQKIINVQGMSCGHCQNKVETAIKSVEGVNKVDVNVNNKQAIVDFDTNTTDVAKISKAIKDAGYYVVNE